MSNDAKTEFEVEVFRPGTFTDMHGTSVTFSEDDLRAVANTYDVDLNPAPAVVGHPKTDDPAYGWVHGFRYDETAKRLMARVGDVVAEFAEALKSKAYRKVSLAFHAPTSTANPAQGSYYPKHLGFLGAVAPAVSGLKPVEFAGNDDEVVAVEFSIGGFKPVASILSGLRDWLIEKEGREVADQVLPDWEIDWIRDHAKEDDRPHMSYAAVADPAKISLTT